MAVRAPGFRPELEWINTGGRALSLSDFRGRVLLLDFWTYGCINCLHLIPALHEVERRFAGEVAVVGVHSGKFVNERSTRNIARACERYEVHHPVLNDRQFRTWREYAVRAWPTLVTVSPTGYVLDTRAGEIAPHELVRRLERVVEEARASGTLAPEPLSLPPDRLDPAPGVLRFPAKVAMGGERRLFLSDAGHHRVLEIELSTDGARGTVRRRFGSETPGWRDGPAEQAALRAPHGLAAVGRSLYVADTGNHLVRVIDLQGGQVATVAGTGAQARRRTGGGRALEVPLNSPWDLAWHARRLHVAMAGWHQIWSLDPDAGLLEVAAGSGAEEVYDAPREWAALAQPSGLASDGARLFFADPESSAVRRLAPDGMVDTLVGTGLFDFGDRDGRGDEARLQHPLGVAWWAERGELLVADTYNHRVRRLDPATREVVRLAGSGRPGGADGAAEEAEFWEPGGLCIAPGGRHAYVADTNNHAVRVVDLQTGRVGRLELED